jgi:transcriptional regulator with XRE-family HTH domain
MNKNFGGFFSTKRKELGKTLREFCRENGFDAGNISKLERGLLTPPQGKEKRLQYANALGIRVGSDDWLNFCDLATIGAGKLPDYVINDEELLKSVPILFRSIRKEGIDSDKITELIDAIKKEN